MPEIDLRKLHEMQLAQNRNPEIEKDSSHNASAQPSGIDRGIIDLWASSVSTSVSASEVSSSPKIIKKDVWIDTPHERVIETPQNIWATKVKPIKISLSSLSQHQKQKDPERLYQEKEAEIGKLFGSDHTSHEETKAMEWDNLANNQESSQETHTPEESMNLPTANKIPLVDEKPINAVDPIEIQAEPQQITTSHLDPKPSESFIAKEVIAPVINTPLPQDQDERKQSIDQQWEQKESSIEDISENSIQSPQDGASSSTWVAPNQVGFFPELSFITPVSISKEDNMIVKDIGSSTEESNVVLDANQPEAVPVLQAEESPSIDTTWDSILSDAWTPNTIQEDADLWVWDIWGWAQDIEPLSSTDPNIPTSVDEWAASVEIPPSVVSSQDITKDMHDTNKKSLRWVIFWGVVMMCTIGWAGAYLWQNQQRDDALLPPVHELQDDGVASITDLPKNTFSGSMSTGMVSTGNTSTGSTMSNTGSVTSSGSTGTGLIVGTGVIDTFSGSLSFSWKTSSTGVTFSGSLNQSGGVKLPSGTGSLAVANTGSTVTHTSTGKVSSATWSVAQKPNTSTWSIVAPSINTAKYLEGRDYRVYGGGYKLIRTTKKK